MSKTNRKINVLFVVTSMGAGGLETYLVNVLSTIDHTKFKVTIVCTGRGSNFYKDELARLGVKTIFCPNPYSQIGYICRISKIIRDYKIDAVCDFRGDFSASTLLAAKIAGVKSRVAMYRSTRRGFRPDIFRNFYAYMMHQCTKYLATKIIGNTEKVLDAFYPSWKDNDKFAVIYNGVDIEKFSPGVSSQGVREEFGISHDCIVIGHVGTFRLAKNHLVLLESFAKLKAQIENVHLLLVGDGGLRDIIERAIARLRIGGSVTLAGQRKNVPNMLASMDIFFYPSIYEGMPNALVEAMACAKPFVATNISEIAEIVPNDLDCQLFDVDDIEGQAEALRKLVSDINCAYLIGKRAREHVASNFTIASSAEQLLQQLTEFIDH